MLRVGQCAQDVIRTSNMHSQLSVKVVKVIRSRPFQKEQFEEAQRVAERRICGKALSHEHKF